MQRDEGMEHVKRKGERDAVKVMVRVRPFSMKEWKRDNEFDVPISVISMDGNRVVVVDEEGNVKESFEYHKTYWSIPEWQKQTHVFKPFATQKDVFQDTGALSVSHALKGYHSCIFAYGQTGSGKTYTMLGSPDDEGIAGRLIDSLFEEIEKIREDRKLNQGYEHAIEISFMEIYNENVKDLFGEEVNKHPNAHKGAAGRRRSTKRLSRNASMLAKDFKEAREGEAHQQANFREKRRHTLSTIAFEATHESDEEGIKKKFSATVGEPALGKKKSLRRKSTATGTAMADAMKDPNSRATKRRVTLAGPDQHGSFRKQSVAHVSSVFDEICEKQGYVQLRVRQSPAVGTFVEGLRRLGTAQGISTAHDVKAAMLRGMEHRATAATQMNDTSSRSHAIFQICVKARNPASGLQRYSHINLVDLAGSERIKASGAEGDRFTEATKINLSLSTLRRVIDALIFNAHKKKHEPAMVPPYRESMLTYILGESLGGNSKTMMIATVSPAEVNREDSLNTLRYALKAKAIVNTVRVNEQKSSVVVSAMMKEMQNLRDRLAEEAAQNPDSSQALEGELKDMELEYTRMEDEKRDAELKQQELANKLRAQSLEAEKKERELQRLKEEGLEKKHVQETQQFAKTAIEVEKRKKMAKKVETEHITKTIELETEKIQQEEIKKATKEVEDRKEAFRQEMLVVKRKQFALAFHKAFKQTKTSSSRERIECELKATSNRISHAHLEYEWKNQILRDCQRECIHLEEKIKRSEKDHSTIEELRGSTEKMLSAKIKELQEVRRDLDANNLLLRGQLKKQQSSYYMTSERRTKDLHVNQERYRSTTMRLDSVKLESEKKSELLRQLRQQLAVMTYEIDDLQKENEDVTATNSGIKQTVHTLHAGIAELKQHNEDMRHAASSMIGKHHQGSQDLLILNAEAANKRIDVEALESDHDDLRQFVSYRFFPSGKGEQHFAKSGFERSQTMDYRVHVKGGYRYQSGLGSPGLSPRIAPEAYVPSLAYTPRKQQHSSSPQIDGLLPHHIATPRTSPSASSPRLGNSLSPRPNGTPKQNGLSPRPSNRTALRY